MIKNENSFRFTPNRRNFSVVYKRNNAGHTERVLEKSATGLIDNMASKHATFLSEIREFIYDFIIRFSFRFLFFCFNKQTELERRTILSYDTCVPSFTVRISSKKISRSQINQNPSLYDLDYNRVEFEILQVSFTSPIFGRRVILVRSRKNQWESKTVITLFNPGSLR